MKWCLCIGVPCGDSWTSSHGVFGNKTGRPGVSPGGADHQICGSYWTTGKGTLFLWLDHLDLSRCPLLHKSLQPTDWKGSDTTWELRMWLDMFYWYPNNGWTGQIRVAQKSLMEEWLEQASQWHDIYCHVLNEMIFGFIHLKLSMHAYPLVSVCNVTFPDWCRSSWSRTGSGSIMEDLWKQWLQPATWAQTSTTDWKHSQYVSTAQWYINIIQIKSILKYCK